MLGFQARVSRNEGSRYLGAELGKGVRWSVGVKGANVHGGQAWLVVEGAG
jgi:hypothetical protein